MSSAFVVLFLLFGTAFTLNTVSYMDWYFYSSSNHECAEVEYNSCIYCNDRYYKPTNCYGFDECYYTSYNDFTCSSSEMGYYSAYQGDCNSSFYNTTCQFVYSPSSTEDCDQGCTVPVFEVESNLGVSVYHYEYGTGPSVVMQFSSTQASVAGKLQGHYFMDGANNRLAYEGFLTENTYVTSAGYCDYGEWCNSSTSMQFKLSLQNITVKNSNQIGFDIHPNAAILSDDFNTSGVLVTVPSDSHASFLNVDSNWDLSSYSIKTDLFSFSNLRVSDFPFWALSSLPQGVTYADMAFAPRNSGDGIIAYDLKVGEYGVYLMDNCYGYEGSSGPIPVCIMDSASILDDVHLMHKQEVDEMAFTLL